MYMLLPLYVKIFITFAAHRHHVNVNK